MNNCFEVEAVIPYKNGFGLIGRCLSGPIRREDVFVTMFSTETVFGENHNIYIKRKKISSINLIVNEIQYFNHVVEELQTNHSGGIYVIGSGAELLLQGYQIET